MNSVFQTKWNRATGTWVPVSEIASTRGKAARAVKSAALLAACGIGMSMSGLAFGACADGTGPLNGRVSADGGSQCTAAQATYSGINTAYANEYGTTLTFTAADVTITSVTTLGAFTLAVGGANIAGVTAASGSTVHALGDLRVDSNAGTTSRAIYIYSGDNKLLVDGNLTAVRSGSSAGGHAISNFGTLEVMGTGTIFSPNSVAIRNLGTAIFHGETRIQVNGVGAGILNEVGGSLTFMDSMWVTTANGVAMSFTSGDPAYHGSITVLGDATLVTTGAAAHDIAASNGAVLKFNRLLASTQGANANVVNLDTGSTLEAGSGSTLTANADGASAVNVTGTGSKFTATASDIKNLGANTPAVILSDAGTAVLNNSQVSTTGTSSAAARMQGGSLQATQSTLKSQSGSALVLGAVSSGNALSTVTATGSAFSSAAAASIVAEDNAQAQITLASSSMTDNNGTLISSGTGTNVQLLATTASVLAGNAINAAGGTTSLVLDTGATWRGAAQNLSAVTVNGTAAWNMTQSSTVGQLSMGGGTINFASPSSGGYKTLSVSSIGGSGGLFNINTVLNEGGAATQSDLIQVSGDVTGAQKIGVTNVGGTGAQTVGDGIRVVQVGGTAADGAFTLNSPLQAGAYQYQLYRGGSTGASDYFLRSSLIPVVNPTEPDVPSYRPAVPGYVVGPYLAREYGYSFGTLHEREGDQVMTGTDDPMAGNGTWARVSGQSQRLGGGRFRYDTTTAFAQVGADLYRKEGEDHARTTAGVMVRLGNIDARTSDIARSIASLDTHTGNISTNAFSVGGYFTHYTPDGSYIDVVGELTRYEVNYSDTSKVSASQRGYGAALSVEVGKPLPLQGNWKIEPQLQLMAQHVRMGSFNDGVSDVGSTRDNSLRGRAGVRIFADTKDQPREMNKWSPYVVADVVRDFQGGRDVTVASTTLAPEMGRTWWQFGVGMTTQFNKTASFYADLKYQRAFGGGHEGVAARAGLRWNW